LYPFAAHSFTSVRTKGTVAGCDAGSSRFEIGGLGGATLLALADQIIE
jgi:hypothetical protein